MVYQADNEVAFFYIKSCNTCAYSVYFKSKKELNYDRFVDPNLLGAARLVHSDRESIESRSVSLTYLFGTRLFIVR